MGDKNYLLTQLLNCWYLDVDFLDDLICEFWIDIDIDDLKKRFWNDTININTLIYETYEKVKDKFLNENKEFIEKISWCNICEFEDYNIFTNCIDSSIRFNNNEIQSLFYIWRENIWNNDF